MGIEAERLGRAGRYRYGWSNFVVKATMLELLLIVLLYVFLGRMVLWVYLVQSIWAIFSLETINYLEHYGLRRDLKERVTPGLAWHTDTLCSRFMLLELNRHADHHFRASRPYHDLVSHEESPVLPSGYWGMMPILLIPFCWFRVVHPLLDRLETRALPLSKAA